MNIAELPIDKLKQCIENEKNRLVQIQEALQKISLEYEQKRTEFRNILSDLEDKCMELESSQKCAHKFINDCETRLKEIQND